VAWLVGLTKEYDDIDIGLVVSEEVSTSQTALWKMLQNLVGAIAAAFHEECPAPLSAVLSPGIITLTTSTPTGFGKAQILLRAFPSLSSLLHGFDLPSCSLASDGTEVYLTTAAAFACAHRVNLVNPAYRSTTYELRLSKYFKRGVGLAFAHITQDDLLQRIGANWRVAFAHLQFVGKVVKGATAATAATATTTCIEVGRRPAEDCVSDYDETHGAKAMKYKRPRITFVKRWNWMQMKQTDKPPRPLMVMSVDNIQRPAPTLRTVLVSAGLGAPAFHNAHTRKYLDAPVEWFIVEDPSRQYTVSINPRVEDPTTWYRAP
jgi:hypothetical protein